MSEWSIDRKSFAVTAGADLIDPGVQYWNYALGTYAPVPTGFDATKEAYAAWLIGELEAVGEPVDLVGHDWGSILVQHVASQRPDLIRTWAAGSGTVDREYVWHELAQMWQTPDVGEQVMEGMTPDAIADTLADQVGGSERAAAVGSSAEGGDRWSDLDLTFGVADGTAYAAFETIETRRCA